MPSPARLLRRVGDRLHGIAVGVMLSAGHVPGKRNHRQCTHGHRSSHEHHG